MAAGILIGSRNTCGNQLFVSVMRLFGIRLWLSALAGNDPTHKVFLIVLQLLFHGNAVFELMSSNMLVIFN